MSTAERQEARTHLNEEMMALYRENNVSPTGGCLPMLLQLPMFWILYGTIRGLIHTKTFATAAAAVKYCHHTITAKVCAQPLYINHTSTLYKSVIAANGKLDAFGINLANSVRTAGLSWGTKAPLIALILVAIALQYIQIKQVSGRNAAGRGGQSADAANAADHADHLRRHLHRHSRRRERLLHRLEPLPDQPAGVHVPT